MVIQPCFLLNYDFMAYCTYDNCSSTSTAYAYEYVSYLSNKEIMERKEEIKKPEHPLLEVITNCAFSNITLIIAPKELKNLMDWIRKKVKARVNFMSSLDDYFPKVRSFNLAIIIDLLDDLEPLEAAKFLKIIMTSTIGNRVMIFSKKLSEEDLKKISNYVNLPLARRLNNQVPEDYVCMSSA